MDVLTYPNLNADTYRKITPADRPPVPENHLQFIIVNEEQNAVLGTNNLTDLWQMGTVWVYKDLSNFERDNCLTKIGTQTGVSAGAYLDKDRFVVGEDSGNLSILGFAEPLDTSAESAETPEMLYLETACQHDDSLTTLSVFSDKVHLVTGGMDYCIKVWDSSKMIAVHSFSYAHIKIVSCVEAKPESDSVFASCALDNEALVWDIRQPKPASCILKKAGIGLTAVAWKPDEENVLAIGAVDGSITLVDVRNSAILQESPVFSRSVYKLIFNPKPERAEQLACCCDDVNVKVIDTSKDMALIYEDDTHQDFVRDLVWSEDLLLSCGWDGCVKKHVI